MIKVNQVILLIGILLIICVSTSCMYEDKDPGQSSINDKYNEIVTLKALAVGKPPADGMDAFYEELDQLTIADLGCVIRIDYIPWGDERNQINLAISSGKYDLIPGGVFSDYKIMATKNAFINIYDYMYLVPNLEDHYKQYREDYLENCEINGNLYGLPQYLLHDISFGEGFFYREDLRKEWGLEPVIDLHTMESYLYRAKEDERYQDYPMITDNRIWVNLWYLMAGDKYLEVGSPLDTPYVVVKEGDPYTPVSRFETPEFKLLLEKVKQWYDDGILDASIVSSSDNEGTRGLEMMKEDQKPCETNSTFYVMNRNFVPSLYEVDPYWEFEYFDYLMDVVPAYIGDASNNSVISIYSKSKHPEIAIKFLEKVHTNQQYHDLLNYGSEGIHYNLIDSRINYGGIENKNIFSSINGIGDNYLGYSGQSINQKWQEVIDREIDKREKIAISAPYHPLNGFLFDVTNVNTENDAMNNYFIKHVQPLCCGVTNNISEDYESAIEIMKEAGLDAYIDEVGRQLEIFKETK